MLVLQVQMQPLEAAIEDNDNEAGRVLYDQRQTGKYNIHVSIKDVAIIEVDQNELADVSGKTSWSWRNPKREREAKNNFC